MTARQFFVVFRNNPIVLQKLWSTLSTYLSRCFFFRFCAVFFISCLIQELFHLVLHWNPLSPSNVYYCQWLPVFSLSVHYLPPSSSLSVSLPVTVSLVVFSLLSVTLSFFLPFFRSSFFLSLSLSLSLSYSFPLSIISLYVSFFLFFSGSFNCQRNNTAKLHSCS